MVPEGYFVLAAAVVFFAALAHGLTGFGSALVAMPLLALWMEIKAVTPLVALLTLTVNAIFLFPFRRALSPGRVSYLLIGAAAGVPAGIFLLARADQRPVEVLLGVVLVSYSTLSLLRKGPPRGLGRPWAVFLGLASGCLGGAVNTGGPPAVIYAASQSWTKEEVHVTLQFYFFLCGILVVSGHALSGLTTSAVIRTYAALLPVLLAGCGTGFFLHRRVSVLWYRRLLFALLLVLGVMILWR